MERGSCEQGAAQFAPLANHTPPISQWALFGNRGIRDQGSSHPILNHYVMTSLGTSLDSGQFQLSHSLSSFNNILVGEKEGQVINICKVSMSRSFLPDLSDFGGVNESSRCLCLSDDADCRHMR